MTNKNIQSGFFISLLIAALLFVGYIFLPYLDTLVFASILAVVFHPLYVKLRRRPFFKNSPGIASSVMVLLVTSIIIIPLIILMLLCITEATNLYVKATNNPNFYTPIAEAQVYFVRKLGSFPIDLGAALKDYTKNLFSFLVTHVGFIVGNTMNLIFSFFLTLFALYYLIKDGEKLHDKFIGYTPLAASDDERIAKKLVIAFNSVIKGTILIALLQGVLEGVGLFIFGMPNPILLGAVTVITAVIPVVGTMIITIPASIYLFTVGQPVSAIGLFLWGALIVGLIDNLVRPKLIERDTNLHPLLVFISVIGGLNVFGALGFIFGPILLSLLVALLNIYKQGLKNA